MSDSKPEKKGGIKSKIICKYFIQGKCTKGDSCPYLHSQVEKPKDIMQIECPMYNIGFCKNGRNCKFLHVKKDKYIEEKTEDQNKDLSIPMAEEEKNETNSLNKEEEKEKENKYPEIPIWYLEHYFDKPLPLIFSELEQTNLAELTELKKKYGFTNIQPNLPVFPIINKKNKMNLNMNTLNLNFNNFNMNFAFNNNKTDINNIPNNNILQNLFQVNRINMGQKTPDKKFDQYEKKKNSIEFLLNKQENIFYYLVKCKLFEEIKRSQESNSISLPLSLYEKYKNIDIQNMVIIIIIVDEEFQNFSGFAQLKNPVLSEKKEEETLYKIEWLWRTKLSLSKVNHLMNKADNDILLIEGKNGCEIDKDLGFFCCRYMMKRLTKEEIQELTNEKKMFESEKKLLQNINMERYNQVNNNINYINYNNMNPNNHSINSSNKDINHVKKKYENNEMNSNYKNSNRKSDMSNTNTNTYSTKYSEYNKHEKEKDYKNHKDHNYTGRKRHRNDSRSRSRSNFKRDNSEDYSKYYKDKEKKHQDRHHNDYHNYKGNSNYNNKSSNNKKYDLNQRNYKDYKDNNHYQKHKYGNNKNDYSNKKYYN